ncbi:unnamed protein product [Meloidogyne enterolobii]|uniref:Uncharacterized protein n=1 Tax=Meloidogyne enterolobii TaxID=390850 RepID=A0ACB0YIL1_MELEN
MPNVIVSNITFHLLGEKCRGCRLDKCLIEGMDPLMVKTNDMKCRDEFIEMLEKRRNKLHKNLDKVKDDPHEEEEEYLDDGNENLNYNEEDDKIICVKNKYKKLKNKQNYTEKHGQQNYILAPLDAENSQMEHLIRIREAQSRIRNAFMEFDDQQFLSLNLNSLQDILTDVSNIILEASEFSVKIIKINTVKYITKIDNGYPIIGDNGLIPSSFAHYFSVP